MWYVFMTVYSNSKTTDNMEFRLWDASTGVVYDAYPPESIAFQSDIVIGSASSPIVFDGEERIIQNINLKKGWNWVSFNVESEQLSSPAQTVNKLIFSGDEQIKDETNGKFMIYNPKSNQWVGDTFGFDNLHMFLVESPADQKLSVSGISIRDREKMTLPIVKGWNYISYLPSVNLAIKEALGGYEAKEGDIIKSSSAFAMYGEATGWLGSLNYLEPGKGYMLFSTSGGKLIYPDMLAGSGLRSEVMTRADSHIENPLYENNEYEGNMSVVATVAENLPVYTGDKLLTYVGSELRGVAALNRDPNDNTPLYFISISGDQNDAVSFALERNGEVIAQTSPMFDYQLHNVQGNIKQPVILDFVNDLQISIYPNPFKHILNFVLNTDPGDNVEIYLYTIAGQLIHRYSEIKMAGGYLYHSWRPSEDTIEGIYLAVVLVNGHKHIYKLKKN